MALAMGPALIGAPAGAAPPPPQHTTTKDPGKEAKDALDRAGKDLKNAGKELSKAASKTFEEARDRLRKSRDERRAEERRNARAKWGDLLARADVRDELRLHDRRVAYLDYIEQLANDLDRKADADRAKKARDQENDRFDKRMDAIKNAATMKGGNR
jgi:hypothetical protein